MTMQPLTYERVLQTAASVHDHIMVLTAENRAAIRNLPAVLGKRFVDVGIAEQTMVGVAAGLALRGRVPVVHALASFLTMRAFEFVRTDVGVANLPVKLVGGVPGFLSDANGPTHQAIEDIALMRGIPNVQVFSPADSQDLVIGLPTLLESPSPCYIRHNALPPSVTHSLTFVPGRAEVIAGGTDVAILVHGMLLAEVMKAKAELEGSRLSTRVVNMRMLKPVDEEEILHSAAGTKILVTVEDHFITGGLYSIVCETLQRHRMNAHVLPFALEHRWFQPALLDDVIANEGFSGQRIADRIRNTLRQRS
jgi:transketolase